MTHALFSIRHMAALAGVAFLAGCATDWEPGGPGFFFSHQAQARVYAVPATETASAGFEVVPPIGAGGENYWCAAADYARRELGAGWNDKIYVLHGRDFGAVSGRIDSVVFTLSPVERANPKPLLHRSYAFKPGDSNSVGLADGFCQQITWRYKIDDE